MNTISNNASYLYIRCIPLFAREVRVRRRYTTYIKSYPNTRPTKSTVSFGSEWY